MTIIEQGAAERQSTEAEADWSPAVWTDASAVAWADELAELGERVRDYVTASKAPNTLRAYRSDWADFTGWCDARGLGRCRRYETVAAYLTDLAGVVATATLARRVTSIGQAHKAAGHEDPPTHSALVHKTMKGIRRTFGVAAAKEVLLRSADIRVLVATLDLDTLGGLRTGRCSSSDSRGRSGAPSSSPST